MVFKVADSLKMYGEKYSWFAGTMVRVFLLLVSSPHASSGSVFVEEGNEQKYRLKPQ